MRRIESLADVQIVLRDLLDYKSRIENFGTDLHGQRTRNASDGVLEGDYITLRQLNALISKFDALSLSFENFKKTPTGGSGGSGSTPLSPGGTTPPPITPPPGGPPVVAALPTSGEPGQQVIYQGLVWQWVGSGQYPGIPGFWERVVSTAPTISDTHANRAAYLPGDYPEGTTFFETDRSIVYIQQGGAWVYYSGAMAATLATLPSDLGANDVDFRFQATDYRHLYIWGGAAWTFDTNDQGSNFYIFPSPGFFITNGLWGLADGSTYSVALTGGTTTNVTTPNDGTYLRR